MHGAAKSFAIDYFRETTALKSYKYGEYESFEHLLFLVLVMCVSVSVSVSMSVCLYVNGCFCIYVCRSVIQVSLFLMH